MTKYPLLRILKNKYPSKDGIVNIISDYVAAHTEGISQSDIRKDLLQFVDIQEPVVDATIDFLTQQKEIGRVGNSPRGKLIKLKRAA